MGFRAHPNPVWLNLFASAKTLFPNEVTFTATRGYDWSISLVVRGYTNHYRWMIEKKKFFLSHKQSSVWFGFAARSRIKFQLAVGNCGTSWLILLICT